MLLSFRTILLLLVALCCFCCPAQAADDSEFPPKIGAPGKDSSATDLNDASQSPAGSGSADTSSSSPSAPQGQQPSASSQNDSSQNAPSQDDSSQDDSSQDDSSQDDSAARNNGAGDQNPAAEQSGGDATKIPGLATPSPYDDTDPIYDKPFSLSRLRTFKPQRGALTTVSRNANEASDITLSVDACEQLTGSDAQDMDSFKKKLLNKAKDKAAFDLFARMYAGQSQAGQQDKLPPEYQQALADKIQVSGAPSYYNGKTFGELCVKASMRLPEQHVQTAAPLIATLQNFCYRDPDAAEDELEREARQAALARIVQNIAPGAKLPELARQQLLQSASISGELGGEHNDVYCLDMQVEVAPLELLPHVPKKGQPGPGHEETLASSTKADWHLDLSGYQPGEPVPKYGKNLVVYQDANGKSLGPNSREGALAILPATSTQNFSLRVLVSRHMSYDFLYDKTWEFFRIHFANKDWEQAAFVMSMDDSNNPVAYFQSRLQSSQTFPWDMAMNFNDCFLVKQQGKCRFFFNGRFVLAYPTSGTSLTQVRVPLDWNDRLYNVLVKNLDNHVK